jgi:1-deoxy-D-xylulose-5-phosphate synthase
VLDLEGISVALYDMRFLKPLDTDLLHEIFKQYRTVITIEDGTIVGGLGSAVIEFMTEHNYKSGVKRLGIPDAFVEHGTIPELFHECGYDVDGICKTVKELLK